MMSRIDRIKDTISMRRAARAAADRIDEARAQAGGSLPVPVTPVTAAPRSFRDDRPSGEAGFAAQVLGQDGQRRGLRAGPSIHDIARVAYARTEWSGSYDRRPSAGRLAKKVV
jgi:hypothetical protein